MRKPIILFLLLSQVPSVAGEETPPKLTGEPDAFRWLTPTLDVRTRYEFRDVQGLDASHALTARARAGLLTADWHGFSAFGEVEGTYALIDDFRSNPTGSASTDPYVAGNSVISDPENIELNRAWVQFKGYGTTLKAGRQRIKRNNDAFIGNVGWRQNEQTYDAVSLAYHRDEFDLFYAYANNVNRIFGRDANDALPGPPLKDFEGQFHFVDGTYQTGFGTLGAHAYLVDVDNNTAVGQSNSFGVHLAAGPFYAEAAWQSGDTSVGGRGNYDALYGHLRFSKKIGGATYSAGCEYIQESFKTPFATVHAFNGFADAFVLQRIGLNDAGGSYEGISDLYLGYVRAGLPYDVTFKGFLHCFLNEDFGDLYGYEADVILAKKVSDELSVLLKAAFFLSEAEPAYSDIRQLSLQFDYSF